MASSTIDSDTRHWRWGQIHFFPSLLVILAAYYLGLSWFVDLLTASIEANNQDPKDSMGVLLFLKQLFCLGMLGGAMHCHIFIAKEFNEYHRKKAITHAPMGTDFLGYIMQIIGGGLTGLALFLGLKTGLIVVTSGSTQGSFEAPTSPMPYAEWFVAFAGGISTHHVKAFLDKFGRSSTGANGRMGNTNS